MVFLLMCVNPKALKGACLHNLVYKAIFLNGVELRMIIWCKASSILQPCQSRLLTMSDSPEIMASNNDLLYEVLQRLPIKSLIKFKSMSKRWLSLISLTLPLASSSNAIPSLKSYTSILTRRQIYLKLLLLQTTRGETLSVSPVMS